MIWFALGVILAGSAIIGSGIWIERTAQGRVYSAAELVPTHQIGVVLGCAPTLPDGRENLFFTYRIQAAAELFHAGRVTHLLVSGDNSRLDYDEPSAMRDALIEKGVPTERITLDYAGFRTLDSVVRARRVFQQYDFVVVSQAFHVKRAIFIARFHDANVVGFAAQDVPRTTGLKTNLREHLARVKTVLDVTLLNRQPKFLGSPIDIAASTHREDQP